MTQSIVRRGFARWLTGLWLVLAAAPLVLAATDTKPMPDFPHGEKERWLYSTPLHTTDLHGKVVLIDLFTTA
jgi:hypothetical protein